MSGKSWVVLAAVVWLSLFSIDHADAQWGRTNESGNGPSSTSPSPEAAIASGILGIIGEGMKAANQSNHNNHNNHNNYNNYNNYNNHNNHWPNQGNYYPPRYYPPRTVVVQPQVVQPQTVKTEVKSNDLPVAKPEPKKETPIASVPNTVSLNGTSISVADAQNTKEDAKDHVDETVDDLRDDMLDKLEDDLKDLNVDEATKKQIEAKLKKGESVDDLIPAGTEPAEIAERLRNADDAFDALDEIADDAKKGRLKPKDLDDFEDDFGDLFDSGDDLTNDLDVIGEDSFWIDQMENARPGVGGLPPGMGTQIIYVPNMPAGQIVSLGNGTVLVGTGGATNGVVIMSGNVAQIAGLSVGVGPPVPNTDVDVMLSGVLLVNLGDKAVNYNVNSDQFSMTPDFTQVLPGGQTWAVEFDRGGANGKAKYGIADGTFGFTPTETGWELYEQPESKVAIDNTNNQFPFSYVLNNTQQTVAAGQINQHSSKYPLVIRFDNGAGQELRKLLDKEKYSLAVTAEGTIDLFEPAYVEPPIQIAEIAKSSTISGRALLQLDGRSRGGLFSGNGSSTPQKSRGGLLNFR